LTEYSTCCRLQDNTFQKLPRSVELKLDTCRYVTILPLSDTRNTIQHEGENMKFKKLFIEGYFVEYRGVFIVVKKERETGRWLAVAKVKDGLKFIDDNLLDGMYSRGKTRKEAVTEVMETMEDTMRFVGWFRRALAYFQEDHFLQELEYEALLHD